VTGSRGDEHGPGSSHITVVEEHTAGGRRYELGGLDGVRIAVLIHDHGQRDITVLTEDDDEPLLTLAFTAEQASVLAFVLADSSRAAPSEVGDG
jgi:K+/H+ antiporter YhaU regulatory subunit KhtT